jgi:hypothetical protein
MPTETANRSPNKPELKIGPFTGGVGVDIWRNTIQTSSGQRQIRSVTISSRRYRDPETGEWKDSSSYRATDIAILVLALQRALDYLVSNPLPGEADDGETPF